MRVVAALLLCWPLWAGTAEYYTRTECANNGDGTTENCAASEGATGAYNIMSSISSAADGQQELARGNTVYLIGTETSAWNPGGVATGDGSSDFVLRGDHPLGPGGFDLGGSGTTPVSIGGTNRNYITFRNLYFRNTTTNCINQSGAVTDLELHDLTFESCGGNGIRLGGGAANGITISGITCTDIADTANEAAGCIYANPAAGVDISGLSISDVTSAGNGLGRYGVGLYPPDTGTITAPTIDSVTCTGEYTLGCVNVQNDVDDAVVSNVDTTGATGPAMIHVGGQPTTGDTGAIGDCPVTTDRTIVRDVIATGGRINAYQTADGQGLYFDECSNEWRAERIKAFDNEVSGIYLNDTFDGVLSSSISYGNWNNALHVHGKSQGNAFYGLSLNGSDPTGNGQDQGVDVAQFDAPAGTITANTIKNSLIIGNTAKCVDVDGDPSYIDESHNLIYGCPTLAEGFTQTSGLTIDPHLIGGPNPTTAEGFKLKSTSPLIDAATCVYTTGCVPYDYGGRRARVPADIGAWQRN